MEGCKQLLNSHELVKIFKDCCFETALSITLPLLVATASELNAQQQNILLKHVSISTCLSFTNVIPSQKGKNIQDNQKIKRNIKKS